MSINFKKKIVTFMVLFSFFISLLVFSILNTNAIILEDEGDNNNLNSEISIQKKFDLKGSLRGVPLIIDIDNDHELEIITGQRAYDANGHEKWLNYDLPTPHTGILAADLDNDNILEYFYCGTTKLVCVDNTGQLKWSYTEEIATYSHFYTPCIVNTDNDDFLEVITAYNTGKLMCFNYTGGKMWEYEISPFIPSKIFNSAPSIGDLDGNGELEIVINCATYTACIDLEGNEKWLNSGGEERGYIMGISNLDSNFSNLEVLVSDFSNNIICLNYAGEQMWSKTLSGSFGGYINFVDFNKDGIYEILSLTSNLIIQYLSNEGDIIWSYDEIVDECNGFGLCVADVDGDSELEILFLRHTSILVCLDETGDTEWSISKPADYEGPILVADIDRDNIFELFMSLEDFSNQHRCFDIIGVSNSGITDRKCYGGGPWQTKCIDSDGDYLDDVSEGFFQTNKTDRDSDDDNLDDGIEIFQFNSNPNSGDTDNDLIPDEWEAFNGLDLTFNNTYYDTDGEGLTDYEEYLLDFDPQDADMDDDGLTDYEEHVIYGTLPRDSDTDDDNLLDGEEINIWGTNATNPDTDYDLIPDDWEVNNLLNPVVNDADLDNDFDNLTNYEEYLFNTKPYLNDTDGDMLNDSAEVYIYLTNPLDSDSDNDYLSDGEEVLYYGTSPLSSDTDSDLLPDKWEIDSGTDPFLDDANLDYDNDTLTNYQEYGYNTNPRNNDSDDDLIPDNWEILYYSNPNMNDSFADFDNDGLTNYEEYILGTNPLIRDSDEDGMPDGWERDNDLNPLVDDANEDPDDDGLTNIEEYLWQTNPHVPDNIFTTETPTETQTQLSTTETEGFVFIFSLISLVGIVFIQLFKRYKKLNL